MSQTDSNIVKPFLWVLGALVVFTFFIAIIANIYSPKSDPDADPLVQQGLKKQIAPVGQSRVEPAAEVAAPKAETSAESTAQEDQVKAVEAEPAAEPTAAVATAAVAATTAAVVATDAGATAENTVTDTEEQATSKQAEGVSESPEIPLRVRAVVATNCAGCHQEGVRGAQRSDDVAAWTALSEKGIDELTQSVINGKGAMRPRAETSLTDEEIELAVVHMIAQSTGGDATGSAEDTATGESAAATATPAPAAEVAEAASTSTETIVAATTAAVAQAEPIPANVKGVVDTLCASCHISGVADAPKYGDKAAWDQRMAAGIDKVLAAAIAGKGVMPPRGGSQLSDAELRQAIEYMVSK